MLIEDIAKSIRATRDDFSLAFMQAQVAANIVDVDRNRFETIAQSPDNVEAFAEALRYAQQKNWFDHLINAILANRLDNGRIATDLVNVAGNAELQAMINERSEEHTSELQH